MTAIPTGTVIRRNDCCPCGSGKKAKRCCLRKIHVLANLPPTRRQQPVVANMLNTPLGADPCVNPEV